MAQEKPEQVTSIILRWLGDAVALRAPTLFERCPMAKL
jgi:hypothetical protein